MYNRVQNINITYNLRTLQRLGRYIYFLSWILETAKEKKKVEEMSLLNHLW